MYSIGMTRLSIHGVLDIDLPPGATVLQATVRLEDSTFADYSSTEVARQTISLSDGEELASFCLQVNSSDIIETRGYILTARALVKLPDHRGMCHYGVTKAYPWPHGARNGPIAITLEQLYELGGSMAGSGEYEGGGPLLTTYHVIGNRLRPIQYTVIDGLAVVEGCLILGTAQEAADNLTTVQQNPGLLRDDVQTLGAAIKGAQYRWPNAQVPYAIDPLLPDQKRVTDAIAHWEANTSVRFPLRTPANAGQYPNWVEFVPGSGCRATVGMRGGRQLVTLGPNCSTGNCIHEIGHALGLWHEQSRIDRDAYVEVIWANIEPGMEANFYQHIHDGEDIGAYDLGSIMHYGLNAFGVGGQPTMKVVGQAGGATIGQRDGLSPGDRQTIATMYP